MGRTVGIGIQDFEKIRKNNYFYIDKTYFIKEWWESGDDVTLITRPRRFGKTLTMSMLDYFFSVRNAGKKSLFEGLSIWKDEEYRNLQGTFPVISLSFAEVEKEAIINAAQVTGGRIQEMSALLGIGRTTLWRKMKQHGIDAGQFKRRV